MGEAVMRDIYTIQIQRSTQLHHQSPNCDVCQNGCVHLTSLQVRGFTQTGKLPNVCKICNKEFLKVCRMQIRHLTQPEVQPHVCDICGRSFIHAGNLKKHRLLHKKAEPYAVDLEQEIPSTHNGQVSEATELIPQTPMDVQVKQENKQSPSEPNKSESPLLEGNMVFQSEEPLDPEPETKPGVSSADECPEQKCICKQCNKQFRNGGRFAKHCQLHSDKQNFFCGVCKVSFDNAAMHRAHSNEHEDKLEFICNICYLIFCNFVDLQNHCVKLHSNAYNGPLSATEDILGRTIFTCTTCEKTFVQKVAYERHCEVHEGKSRYVCKTCGKRYMQLGRFRIHQRLHRKRYSCTVCNKTFQIKAAYKKHLQSHESLETTEIEA